MVNFKLGIAQGMFSFLGLEISITPLVLGTLKVVLLPEASHLGVLEMCSFLRPIPFVP